MFNLSNALLLLTVFFSGLMAGLFYSYAVSVNPGLKALGDVEYLKAMQAINLAILNAAFFICFMGLLALFPATAFSIYKCGTQTSFYLVVTAAAFYILGVFGTTMVGNVPLNNQLASFDIAGASSNQLSNMRATFEGPWNRYHAIRTFCSIISFVLMAVAAFRKI